MNGMVDSRVVEMHFDNSDFMDKINETIEALEKLNDQISSINQTQGLRDLGGNMASQDMSNVANAVGNIEQRFSTLGIVGMTVIQRLTNAGIDMALKIGNGIKAVGNQIKTGGFIRAEKLEQAKFLLEGLGADVEGIMGRVNEAVDGTAYGLDEAAKASASFYASGIKDLDKMEATLKSVSGVAALVGSDYSSIAEIFTTVAGQEKLMTMQLRQLESRGLNAAAYLAEYFGTTEEAVRDMVTKGEVSFEDFTAAMSKFADHAKDANKTFSGSMANMKTALSRLGEAFITPAMEAAIPLFNGIREAISAFTTELKTDLPDNEGLVTRFSHTIDHFGNRLGVMLRLLNGGTFSEDEIKSFSEKGYKDLEKIARAAKSTHSIFKDFGHSVGNIGKLLVTAFERIGEAAKEVFPKASVENFRTFMMSFNASISNFYRAHKEMDGFKNVMVGVFSIFKAAFNIISGILRVFVAFGRAVTGFLGHTVSLSEGFANIGKGLAKLTGATDIFDFFVSVIDGAGKVVGKAFETIFESFSKFIGSVGKTVSGIDNVNDALAMMGIIWTGLFGARKFELAKNKISGIGKIFKGFSDALRAINFTPGKINTMIDQVTTSLSTMTAEVQSKAVRNVALAILALAVGLKILADLDNEGLTRGLAGVTVLLTEMAVVMKILMGMAAGDAAKSMKGLYAMGSVTNALIKIGAAMILMAIALKTISELDPKQLAAGLVGMTVMLAAVLGFVIALDKFQTNAADAKVGSMMIGVALALVLIAKAVQTMGSLKPTELAKGLASVIVVMAAIFGFMAAMNKMGGASKGMVLAGIGMIAIATAVNILAPALQKLGSMSLEQMAKGLSAMAIAMVTMAAVSKSMSAGGAVGMLVMSMALSSLGSTIERIGSLDIITIAKGLGTIIVAIAALGAAAVLLAPASAALLALGGAMMLVSLSFAVFGAGLTLIGAGLTSISAGIMSFSSVTSTAVGMFVNTVKMLLQELINLLPSLAAAIAESFVTFLEQIAELAPRFTEAVTTIIHSLLEAVENNLPDIIAAGIRMILKFLEGMEEAIPRIAGTVADIISGFLNALADKMPEIIDSGINLAISFIEGLAQGIRNNKERFARAIEDLCMAGLEAFLAFFGIASPSKVMEEQGVNLIDGLIAGISGNAARVGEALVEGIKNLPGKVGAFVGKLRTSGRQLITNFLSGLGNRKDEIKKKFTEGVESAKKKLKNSSLYSTGKNLVQGFLDGCNALKGKVTQFWNWLSDKARKIMEKKNEISSPSKVYYRYGKYIMQGFINGLNELKDKPINTLEKLSDEMSNIDYSLSGIDEPTITPVLDLSEVRKGAKGIDSLFGNESISLSSPVANSDIQNIQNNNLMNQMLMKMDRLLNTDTRSKPTNITNTFTVNGNDNPEEFVNTFIRTLDREMQMRAV